MFFKDKKKNVICICSIIFLIIIIYLWSNTENFDENDIINSNMSSSNTDVMQNNSTPVIANPNDRCVKMYK